MKLLWWEWTPAVFVSPMFGDAKQQCLWSVHARHGHAWSGGSLLLASVLLIDWCMGVGSARGQHGLV